MVLLMTMRLLFDASYQKKIRGHRME